MRKALEKHEGHVGTALAALSRASASASASASDYLEALKQDGGNGGDGGEKIEEEELEEQRDEEKEVLGSMFDQGFSVHPGEKEERTGEVWRVALEVEIPARIVDSLLAVGQEQKSKVAGG